MEARHTPAEDVGPARCACLASRPCGQPGDAVAACGGRSGASESRSRCLITVRRRSAQRRLGRTDSALRASAWGGPAARACRNDSSGKGLDRGCWYAWATDAAHAAPGSSCPRNASPVRPRAGGPPLRLVGGKRDPLSRGRPRLRRLGGHRGAQLEHASPPTAASGFSDTARRREPATTPGDALPLRLSQPKPEARR